MTTIPTHHTPVLDAEANRAMDAVADAVTAILSGEYTGGPTALARPIPVAFLDDGRRVFLIIDNPHSTTHAPGRPRAWGVEVARDGDLVGGTPGDRTAVRTTGQLTTQAAVDATRYLLTATR